MQLAKLYITQLIKCIIFCTKYSHFLSKMTWKKKEKKSNCMAILYSNNIDQIDQLIKTQFHRKKNKTITKILLHFCELSFTLYWIILRVKCKKKTKMHTQKRHNQASVTIQSEMRWWFLSHRICQPYRNFPFTFGNKHRKKNGGFLLLFQKIRDFFDCLITRSQFIMRVEV